MKRLILAISVFASVLTNAQPIISLCSAKHAMLVENKTTPYDAEVEYLETDGKSWFDTGLKTYNKATPLSEKLVRYSGYIGPAVNAGSDWYNGNNGWGFWGFKYGRWCVLDTTSEIYPITRQLSFVEVIFTSTNITMKIDDNLIIRRSGQTGNDYSYGIGLCCIGNNDGTVTGAYGNRKWMLGPMLIESCGETRDFIPVRIQNIGCLYDRANPYGGPNGNGIYYNGGTGKCILGPDKINNNRTIFNKGT